MKQQKKNIEASRDTAPVVRSGTRVLPSREASLFQKMKKSITQKNRRNAKNEVPVPFVTSLHQLARLKRAAKLGGETIDEYISAAVESFIEMTEELMEFDQEGRVIAFYTCGNYEVAPVPLKKPYPPIAA
jgi:hypothetical protein